MGYTALRDTFCQVGEQDISAAREQMEAFLSTGRVLSAQRHCKTTKASRKAGSAGMGELDAVSVDGLDDNVVAGTGVEMQLLNTRELNDVIRPARTSVGECISFVLVCWLT